MNKKEHQRAINRAITKAIVEQIKKDDVNLIKIGLFEPKSNFDKIESVTYYTREHYEKLLINNKIDQMFSQLLVDLKVTKQNDLYDSILLLASRFNRNEEKARKNIISNSEYDLELNKIINSIAEYLKDYQPE